MKQVSYGKNKGPDLDIEENVYDLMVEGLRSAGLDGNCHVSKTVREGARINIDDPRLLTRVIRLAKKYGFKFKTDKRTVVYAFSPQVNLQVQTDPIPIDQKLKSELGPGNEVTEAGNGVFNIQTTNPQEALTKTQQVLSPSKDRKSVV